MLKAVRRSIASQAGFTLIELLIVVLIVGVLAAVGAPLYLGYVREARLAEGKAFLGSALTAAQACAQIQPGTSCSRLMIAQRVGVNSAFQTGDGRWQLNDFNDFQLGTGASPVYSGSGITVQGVAGTNVSDLSAMIVINTGVASMRCRTDGTVVTSGTGDPC